MNLSVVRPPLVAAMLALLASAPAYAQAPRPERPARALFGSGVSDAGQLLTVGSAFSAGWDTSLASDARGGDSTRFSDFAASGRGMLGSGSATVAYSLETGPVTLAASAGTYARYYPSLSKELYRREQGQVRGTIQLPLALSASGSVTYAPFSLASMYPAMFGAPESDLPDDNFAVSPEYYVTWNGNLGTNRRLQLSRRLTLTADTDFSTRSDSTRADTYQSFGGGGTLRYAVGRGLALKAGYFYTRALYSVQDRRVNSHQFDVGVDFNRALSISRRTSLSFSTGTSAVTQADGSGTRLRATGTASLEHEIGRTWTAALNYRRGMQFMETWPEPVFSDALTVTFGGLLTRRLQFSANGRASTGEVGVGNSSGFGAYHGGATLSYALSRFANVGVAYSRYHHRFDETARLAPGFGPSIDRQRVVAQVSLWAPLFHRARRDNAAR